MSLINAKPRFAYDPEDNTVFDYATSKHVPASGTFESTDGKWDAGVLAQLIASGQDVNSARVLEGGQPDVLLATYNAMEAKRLEGLAQFSVPPAPPESPTENAPDSQPVDKVEQANRDFLADGVASPAAEEMVTPSADVAAPAEPQPADVEAVKQE